MSAKTANISQTTTMPTDQSATVVSWKIPPVFSSDVVLISFLVAISLLCFSRTIGGYFLADDFIHVAYLSRVFHGHPEMLLTNFFSNWLQAQGTQFYRPMISLTLAFDYLLWGSNATGYHLTNLTCHIASSIFLFLLSRRLLQEFGSGQAGVAAFFSAALFAAFPLHPEVVSWVIGRVDSVCAAFYLAAFWLFLKAEQDNSRQASAISLLAFCLSLCSKEMAITLPPALFLYRAMRPVASSASLLGRLSSAVRATAAYWVVLGAYLAGRTLALGTIAGGYSGSIGEGLTSSLLKRWFHDSSFSRVVFPFNALVFSPGDHLRKTLRLLYLLSGASLLARILWRPRDSGLSRYALFALGWFIVSMSPTYQVWNLTDSLQGSRFIYLGTAPLCLLLALLVFPLNRAQDHMPGWRYMKLASGVLLLAFTLCFASITAKNNLPWARAGAELRALRAALQTALTRLPPSQKLVILNCPQRREGAHMLYNGAMLSVLLSSPLTEPTLCQRVVSFEPMTYGDDDLIIVSRLRRMLMTPGSYAIYSWDRKHQTLIPLDLSGFHDDLVFGPEELAHSFTDHRGQPNGLPVVRATKQGLFLSHLAPNTELVSPELDVPACAYDFVDVELLSSLPGKSREPGIPNPILSISWLGTKPGNAMLSLPVIPDGQRQRYRFCVSQHKSWISSEKVVRLRLHLPQSPYQNVVRSVRLISGHSLIPSLSADPRYLREGNDGVCQLLGSEVRFRYDACRLQAADHVVAEISKPDAWFEHYSGQLRDDTLSSHGLKRITLPSTTGGFSIHLKDFPQPGYYEVRIAGVTKTGAVINYVSDPINLQISQSQLAKHFDADGGVKSKALTGSVRVPSTEATRMVNARAK